MDKFVLYAEIEHSRSVRKGCGEFFIPREGFFGTWIKLFCDLSSGKGKGKCSSKERVTWENVWKVTFFNTSHRSLNSELFHNYSLFFVTKICEPFM